MKFLFMLNLYLSAIMIADKVIKASLQLIYVHVTSVFVHGTLQLFFLPFTIIIIVLVDTLIFSIAESVI